MRCHSRINNHLHLPFRKKKQSRLKLTLQNLSLIAMWRYPIAIKLTKQNTPKVKKTLFFL
ncbi:hypothetical protein BK771_23770 [Bacillus thuringiensis serovar ostriniae]|nr:hypothetical protein BK771_23770 [Bacillus thuringiensis serovar ostriniae]